MGEVELTRPFAILDNLSLSNWALKAFEMTIGVNPLEWVAARVADDWEAFSRAGKALAHSADALGDVAYNVQGGDLALGPYRTGRAADAGTITAETGIGAIIGSHVGLSGASVLGGRRRRG